MAYWPATMAYWPATTAYWPATMTYWPATTAIVRHGLDLDSAVAYWSATMAYWPANTDIGLHEGSQRKPSRPRLRRFHLRHAVRALRLVLPALRALSLLRELALGIAVNQVVRAARWLARP